MSFNLPVVLSNDSSRTMATIPRCNIQSRDYTSIFLLDAIRKLTSAQDTSKYILEKFVIATAPYSCD